MILPFKIALRFLKSSKGQTLLITLGIAIGVSVQIFIGLLIQGLQVSLVDKTIGSSSHITIAASSNSDFDDYENFIYIVEDNIQTTAISPALDKPAFISIGEDNRSILVRGFELENANNIYKFQSALLQGAMPNGQNEIIIGNTVFEEGDFHIGDEIDLIVPNLAAARVTITGVFDLKVAAINKTWFVTNLQTAQAIFEKTNMVNSIEIQIRDIFNSDVKAENIKKLINNEQYSVKDWQSQNEELLSGLNGQSISSIMIQVFVIIAVLLGIASVLAVSVLQKSKQIGILKAMGIKDGSSSIIFLTQGFILGLMGAIVGILLGVGLIVAFTTFALNPDGTPLIPIALDVGFIVFSGIISIVAAMSAALIPAIKSMKMNPIEVIRNG